MEYMHGGDIYTYENVTDYSVNLNPFGPGEEVLLAMEESLKHAGSIRTAKAGNSEVRWQNICRFPRNF